MDIVSVLPDKCVLEMAESAGLPNCECTSYGWTGSAVKTIALYYVYFSTVFLKEVINSVLIVFGSLL